MNQLLEKLKALDPKYLYGILAAAILIFCAVDFFLVMRPQVDGLVALNKKVVQFQSDIDGVVANKQRLAQFKKQLDIVRRDVKNFNAMVHKKDEIPLVLKTISTAANQYGVKIEQLLPQQPSVQPLVQNQDGKYHSMTISIAVRSGFHQFGKFLNRLEQQRVFWQIDEFTVSADDSVPQRHNIKMDMKIIILEK